VPTIFRRIRLRRRARRDAELPDAKAVNACVESGAEDGIASSDQTRRHDVCADGVDDLLARAAAAVTRESEKPMGLPSSTLLLASRPERLRAKRVFRHDTHQAHQTSVLRHL
jgi:hypothetical protein